MINLYSWPTPNGIKIHIMLEECNIDYNLFPINIGNDEQFNADFLAISPNNKIPAMVDSDGPNGTSITLFESGAILYYLAQKTGILLPDDPAQHYTIMQWLMFQMGGLGPMLGQAHHFRVYATEHVEYAYNRYTNEANRLYHVMNKQLSSNPYIAGHTLSIADIAIFPWCIYAEQQGVSLDDKPHMARWLQELQERPTFKRASAIAKQHKDHHVINGATRAMIVGDE